MGQLVYDVKLAAGESRPIELYGTAGGIVPSPDQVADRIRKLLAERVSTGPTKPVNTQWLPVCEQAQADGVPCPELGRDCEVCERAYTQPRDEAPYRRDV